MASRSRSPTACRQRAKWLARDRLVVYCFTTTNTLQQGKLQDKFELGDRDKVEKAVKETLDWLEQAQRAEVPNNQAAYEAKQKELEGVVNPIMMNVIIKLPYRRW